MARFSDFSKTLCVDVKTFRRMQLRWAKTLKSYNSGEPCLDPGIVGVLKSLNSIDGIVTNWSCESHSAEYGDSDPQVVMAVTSKGLESLKRIRDSLDDAIGKYNRRCRGFMMVNWTIVSLLDPTLQSEPPVIYAHKKYPTYVAHEIKISNMDQSNKADLLKLFNQVIKKVKRESC